jgi:GNAT superfamily N-acetyltransferase
MPRLATIHEAPTLARLINAAFVVEAFFKIGERTDPDEVAALIKAGGEFLVVDDDSGTGTGTGTGPHPLLGCVYLKCSGERAYLGMLSVAPGHQRGGLGRRLVAAAEGRARERGCRWVDINIVSLRKELLSYYQAAGYVVSGALPFPDESKAKLPCFLIVLTKSL